MPVVRVGKRHGRGEGMSVESRVRKWYHKVSANKRNGGDEGMSVAYVCPRCMCEFRQWVYQNTKIACPRCIWEGGTAKEAKE